MEVLRLKSLSMTVSGGMTRRNKKRPQELGPYVFKEGGGYFLKCFALYEAIFASLGSAISVENSVLKVIF